MPTHAPPILPGATYLVVEVSAYIMGGIAELPDYCCVARMILHGVLLQKVSSPVLPVHARWILGTWQTALRSAGTSEVEACSKRTKFVQIQLSSGRRGTGRDALFL